ncbi:MAG: T9SS type A sorting domain-containing protein, partial [Bacteroidetes bacterium]|nr:T9SS type A sorting domain-containing protein [Bacteroidota bacterium]
WAIDDVELTLAPIAADAGVTAITTPTSPSAVGDIITVSVTVKNFGYGVLSNIPVKYQVGTGAVVTGTIPGPLAPGATTNYTFTQTFMVGLQNYNICAYTAVAGDLYTQNDKTCKSITVVPAQKDVGVSQLIQPSGTVSQSSTVTIQVRIKNYGLQTQSSIPVFYQRGFSTPVSETFAGPLAAGDSAVYTFTTQMAIPIGASVSFASWTKLTNDAYPFNDTISKSITICNVAAAGAISGLTTVLPGSVHTYTVPAISNATSYNWVLIPSSAGTITGTGNTVTVTFSTTTSTATLTVSGVGANCSGNPSAPLPINITTGVNEYDINSLWLGQNMPNPTTGVTYIEYNLPSAGEIKFDIMNLFGQKVYSTSSTEMAGKHKVNLELNKLADGIYYYTLEFKGKRLVKKMLINK